MAQIQDYSTGTPATTDLLLSQTAGGAYQQYTTASLLSALSPTSVYGELYEKALTGGTGISCGTSYVGWVSATEGEIAGAPFMTSDTAHATADRLIIGANGAGVYGVWFACSYAGTGAAVFTLAVHKNGVESHIAFVGVDTESGGSFGLLTLAASDYLDVRVKASGDGKVLTPYTMSLVALRLIT